MEQDTAGSARRKLYAHGEMVRKLRVLHTVHSDDLDPETLAGLVALLAQNETKLRELTEGL